MQKSKEVSICQKAIQKYGKSAQMVVAIEECSELQKALTKTLREQPNLLNIAEEIADVEIMIEQLKLIFKNERQVEEFKKHKLMRLEKNLKSVNKTE